MLTQARPIDTTWLDAFPGLPGDVVAGLKARRIRSVAGAFRAALAANQAEPIARAVPAMQLDPVLDREAARLFLMLQMAAEVPPESSSGPGARPRRRVAGC